MTTLAPVRILHEAEITAWRGVTQHQAQAGLHLALAREHEDVPLLAQIHRDLAEDQAARAQVWRREAKTFGAAADSLRERLENRAKELELAQQFNEILDAQNRAAAAPAEDHSAWEDDRLMGDAA